MFHGLSCQVLLGMLLLAGFFGDIGQCAVKDGVS
jgi:hypothetical protein